MDIKVIQPVSASEEIQDTGLSSIHIQDSHPLAIACSIVSNPVNPVNPVMNNNMSFCYALFYCLWQILRLILLVIYFLFRYPFYWLILLLFGVLFFFFIVGPLSFIFLLASLLVLRYSQFIKRGGDYDQVTQVKVVVEWFMVVNCVLLAFGMWFFCAIFDKFISSESATRILGKTLFEWGHIVSKFALAIFGIRFVIFWIIQKNIPRMTLEHNESGIKVVQATCDIVDCFFFQYLGSAIIDYFPQHKILGYPTRNWIDVTLFVIIGCNVIALSTHFIVWSIHRLVSRYLDLVHDDTERSHRYLLLERLLRVQWLVYYGNGMKRSFNFMFSSLLLLLVWVFFFGLHLTRTNSKAKTVWDFGTRTCIILLLLSFLWLLKDYVLLSWEASAVYNRLSSKILEARKSLYFLGMLGRHSHDIFKLRYEVVKNDDQSNDDGSTKSRAQVFLAKNLARVSTYDRGKRDLDDNDEMTETRGGSCSQLKPKLSNKKRERVKHDLLLLKNDTMTLFNVQQVAQYFLAASDALLKETYTSDILKKFDGSGENRAISETLNTQSNVSDVIQNLSNCLLDDWKCFDDLLDLSSSNHVCHIQLKQWIEKSHSKCLFLASTLRSAKEIVDCLDNIISVLLICASFILWLIFTGLADTKALVLIASPLLAATFIFGDTCKSLFQGIIYIYVVHPFDVGDLCVIDEIMMEVKSIGVWKTTFLNVDKARTHEEVIYPNSELALKKLINHKTEFDWNDFVEFNVEHLDEQQIKELQKQIEDFLDAGNDESVAGSRSVAVRSTGTDIRIAVRFRHNKQNVDMTYFECVKEKDCLHSAFILDVQNLAKKVERG